MSEGIVLTREAILGRDDVRIELLDVPEWGGQVYVRGLGADERDEWEFMVADGRKSDAGHLDHFRARYAALVLCDESGARIFTEADVEALGKKSGAALDRIFDKGIALSRMEQDAVEKAKEDFDDGPSDDSGFA